MLPPGVYQKTITAAPAYLSSVTPELGDGWGQKKVTSHWCMEGCGEIIGGGWWTYLQAGQKNVREESGGVKRDRVVEHE